MTKVDKQVQPQAVNQNDKITLDKKGEELVKNAVETLTTGKKDLTPSEVLAILAKRERKIVETADKLKGLKKLREELDDLRSWDAQAGTHPTEITIKGEGIFKTHNAFIIQVCKLNLEQTFETRIEELEKELATVEI